MSVVVKCPFCSKEGTILEEHAGQQLNCPYCQQIFIAPAAEQLQAVNAAQNTPPPPPAAGQLGIAQQQPMQNAAQSAPPRILSRSYSDSSYRHSKSSVSDIFGGIKTIFGILSGIAVLAAIYFNFFGYQSSDCRQMVTELLPKLFKDSNFIYPHANFVTAKMEHDKDDLYKGHVEFTREGKSYQRNVIGRRQGQMLEVIVLREYCKHPKHLVEDADIWYYNHLRANNYKLRDYDFVDATVLDNSESGKYVRLSMKLKNTNNYSTTYIKVRFNQTGSDFKENYGWEWEDFDSFY